MATRKPTTTPQTGDARGADRAQTLERGLAVLQIVAEESGLTAAELTERTGLHRSVVRRLLVSLQRTGYVERDARGRYQVGRAVVALADRARPRLHTVAQPVLQELAITLDATASLVEVIADAAVTTVVAEPLSDGPRFSYRLGSRDPLHHGAGGLAALASGPPLDGEPERIGTVREAGVVSTYGELNPGAYGVAAPICDLPSRRAAVAVITSRADVAERAQPAVRVAAARIADVLSR